MSKTFADEFFSMGGIIYKRTNDPAKPEKICIVFEDEKGNNRKLLLESLNKFIQKGNINVT